MRKVGSYAGKKSIQTRLVSSLSTGMKKMIDEKKKADSASPEVKKITALAASNYRRKSVFSASLQVNSG